MVPESARANGNRELESGVTDMENAPGKVRHDTPVQKGWQTGDAPLASIHVAAHDNPAMSWKTRLNDWWAGLPHEQSEAAVPEGLSLVRQAASIPEMVLEAWWREHWPDVNARDDSGRTPLWWAAAEGDSGSVAALVALGADPQCAEHHKDTCSRLLHRRAGPARPSTGSGSTGSDGSASKRPLG